MIQATIPDLVVDLCAMAECVQDMAIENLAGGRHKADAKTLTPSGPQYVRPGSPVEAGQKKVARENLQRAKKLDRELGTTEGAE